MAPKSTTGTGSCSCGVYQQQKTNITQCSPYLNLENKARCLVRISLRNKHSKIRLKGSIQDDKDRPHRHASSCTVREASWLLAPIRHKYVVGGMAQIFYWGRDCENCGICPLCNHMTVWSGCKYQSCDSRISYINSKEMNILLILYDVWKEAVAAYVKALFRYCTVKTE
jgi:hypothetical protein